MALAFADSGKEFVITDMRMDEKLRRHLNNLGFVVGGRVRVCDGSGDVICRVLDTKLAIGRPLAMKISVEEVRA